MLSLGVGHPSSDSTLSTCGSIWRAANWHFSLRNHQGRGKPCWRHEKVVIYCLLLVTGLSPLLLTHAWPKVPTRTSSGQCSDGSFDTNSRCWQPGGSSCDLEAPAMVLLPVTEVLSLLLLTATVRVSSNSALPGNWQGSQPRGSRTRSPTAGPSQAPALSWTVHPGNPHGSGMFSLVFGAKTILGNVIYFNKF